MPIAVWMLKSALLHSTTVQVRVPPVRFNRCRFQALGVGKPGGDAAGAVAAELGLGAVGVEQAQEVAAVGAAVEELDAVRAQAVVTGAQVTGKRGVPAVRLGFLEDEKVVAAGVGFYEGDQGWVPLLFWKVSER